MGAVARNRLHPDEVIVVNRRSHKLAPFVRQNRVNECNGDLSLYVGQFPRAAHQFVGAGIINSPNVINVIGGPCVTVVLFSLL